MNVDRDELAWAGEFFSRSGTIGVRDKYPYMRLERNEPDDIDAFHAAILGAGSVADSLRRGAPRYLWQAQSFVPVQAACVMLAPFVTNSMLAKMKPVLLQTRHVRPRDANGIVPDGIPDDATCQAGHPARKYRNKHKQCRKCMQLSQARHKGTLTPEWYAKWLAEE